MTHLLPNRKFLRISLTLALFILPSLIHAEGMLGGTIYTKENGNVSVTFSGSSAQYTSTLYLQGYGKVLSTNVSAGTTIDVGYFDAGKELTFYILVENTGHTFYTGSGALNADGAAHAYVESLDSGTKVSFEDKYGGGDEDYDDLQFIFTNTKTDVGITSDPDSNTQNLLQQPEPSTMVLLGSGLLGLGAWRLRKKDR